VEFKNTNYDWMMEFYTKVRSSGEEGEENEMRTQQENDAYICTIIADKLRLDGTRKVKERF